MKSRMPVARLLRLDRAIRAGSYPTAPQLARNLSVSPRTVQRDIEHLRRIGAPIRWNASRKGYEYADPSFIPKFEANLTEGELLSVLAAETILPAYRGTPYEGILRRLFLKIGKAFGAPLKLKMSDLVANTQPEPSAAATPSKLPRAVPKGDGKVPVVLRFTPLVTPQVSSLDWPEEYQLQTVMDGGLELTLEADDADEVIKWMLQWGTDVEIVSPRWARKRLLQILDAIGTRYRPRTGPKRKSIRRRATAIRRRGRRPAPSLKAD